MSVPLSKVVKSTAKSSKMLQNIQKAPENSTDFLYICPQVPKEKHPKSSTFKKKNAENFSVFVKIMLPSSGEISIWRQLSPSPKVWH